MALKSWATNEVPTNANMNLIVNESPDTVLYAVDNPNREYTGTGSIDVSTAPDFEFEIDVMLGQYIYVVFESKDTVGTYSVTVTLVVPGNWSLELINLTENNTSFQKKSFFRDLRLDPPGEMDQEGRGRRIRVKFYIGSTAGTATVRGVQIHGGNTNVEDDYGNPL